MTSNEHQTTEPSPYGLQYDHLRATLADAHTDTVEAMRDTAQTKIGRKAAEDELKSRGW